MIGVIVKFYNALRKYGKDNLSHEILLENVNEADIATAKTVMVVHQNSYTINLRNNF